MQLGECTRIFEGHTGWIIAIEVSTQHQLVFSCGRDHSMRWWDYNSGECVRIFELESMFSTMHLHEKYADGSHGPPILLIGTADGTLLSWNIKTRKPHRAFIGHVDRIRCVKVEKNWLLSASADGKIRKWNLSTGTCDHVFVGHSKSVNFFYIFDEHRLYSTSDDGSIRIWPFSNSKERHQERKVSEPGKELESIKQILNWYSSTTSTSTSSTHSSLTATTAATTATATTRMARRRTQLINFQRYFEDKITEAGSKEQVHDDGVSPKLLHEILSEINSSITQLECNLERQLPHVDAREQAQLRWYSSFYADGTAPASSGGARTSGGGGGGHQKRSSGSGGALEDELKWYCSAVQAEKISDKMRRLKKTTSANGISTRIRFRNTSSKALCDDTALCTRTSPAFAGDSDKRKSSSATVTVASSSSSSSSSSGGGGGWTFAKNLASRSESSLHAGTGDEKLHGQRLLARSRREANAVVAVAAAAVTVTATTTRSSAEKHSS